MITKILAPYNAALVIDGFTLSLGGGYGGGYSFVSNPPLVAGDVQRSIGGGAFSNLATLPTVVPAADTSVRISLSAAELLSKRTIVRFIDQTAPRAWDDRIIMVETYGHASSAHPNIGEVMRGTDNAMLAANGALEATVNAVKTKTDQLSFISGDVVATLDDETVVTTPGSSVVLEGDLIKNFPESTY